MVAGSSGTTESSWPWQITMPPECWPRCRGRSCDVQTQIEKFPDARLAHIEAGGMELRFERVGFVFVFQMADQAGQTIERLRDRNPSTLPTSRAAERPR